jgi:hypothetical protein
MEGFRARSTHYRFHHPGKGIGPQRLRTSGRFYPSQRNVVRQPTELLELSYLDQEDCGVVPVGGDFCREGRHHDAYSVRRDLEPPPNCGAHIIETAGLNPIVLPCSTRQSA